MSSYHLCSLQEKDLGDDASLRSIDIKEELRRMTLDMVKVTGLLGAVARLKKHTDHKLNQQLEALGRLIKY